MPQLSQANQPAQISVITGLQADDLLLERFVATERLSTPFDIILEAISVNKLIDFQPHLGKGVGIRVQTDVAQVDRFFHGVLYEALTLGADSEATRYRLTLKPWLSLLDIGFNTRIFQKKSVQDIIKQVFSDANFTAFSLKLDKAGADVREYCVQFRESDFHFVSRLMEEEGIYYYFAHAEGGHTMMLCDAPASHPAFAHGPAEVRPEDRSASTSPHLRTWERRVKPAIIKATLFDAHFQKPTTILQSTTSAGSVNAAEAAEHYDFPGGFGYFKDDGSEPGDAYVATRLLEERAERETFFSGGDVFAIPVGQTVAVQERTATVAGLPKITPVLIVAATHTMGVQTYLGANADDEEAEFHIEFEAVPIDTKWKAPCITDKPLAGGPQVATVVGKSGEVVDVDQFGRVKIQFPWDRIGKNDENSSCWVRVSQGWADGGFGQIMIPRIGEEVIVDFLDGDPDRPIITGRVYNSALKVPYDLPKEKTKSTWKSQTIGDSGSYDEAEDPPTGKGFNEIRFEDKGGVEEFFIHAQRIFNSWIRLDETRKTGRDTKVRIGRNRDVSIQKNETVTIVAGDETRKIQAGSRQTTIEKADTLTLNSGDYSLKVSSGQATLEAQTQITLKVGQSTITMTPTSIELKSTNVKVTADVALSAAGLTTELKASATNTISGAMVMIN